MNARLAVSWLLVAVLLGYGAPELKITPWCDDTLVVFDYMEDPP